MLLHILKLPPLHVLLCVLGMKTLTVYFPQSTVVPMHISTILWIACLVFALSILVISVLKFRRHRTNIEAFREPNNLITSGIFAITRNPIYIGFLIAIIGAAFYFNQPLAFVFVPVFFLLADLWYIPHEEKDATRIFGQEFEAYKKRVRRWI